MKYSLDDLINKDKFYTGYGLLLPFEVLLEEIIYDLESIDARIKYLDLLVLKLDRGILSWKNLYDNAPNYQWEQALKTDPIVKDLIYKKKMADSFRKELEISQPRFIQKDSGTENNNIRTINSYPANFDEMFVYPELIQDCIDALKKVEPPIVTIQNAYALGSKSKGSIVAWVSALKQKGHIKSNLPESIIAPLLNSKFEGLNMGKDGRTLRNIGTSGYKKYYTDLLSLLPTLPLSA